MTCFPKKVAILLPSLKFGGGERVSLNLAREMKNLGVAVDILLMSKEGDFLAEAEKEFAVYDLQCNKTYMLPYRLLQYLVRNRTRVVISNFWKLNLCACISRLCYPFFKLILWEHSPPSKSPFAPAWVYTLSASVLYRFSSEIVAVSNGVRDDINNHSVGLSSKLHTIYNPIAPPRNNLIPTSVRETVEQPLIISLGRLERDKNIELLLHAFAILIKKMNANLLIVGDGSQRDSLECLSQELGLKDHVRFFGFTNNPYELMAGSDLLVLSSDLEGLPTVIVEALYCGLPIVSTDCPCGPRELLEDGKYGSLVPMNDSMALATAMEYELVNKRLPEVQKLAAKRFLPKAAAEKFLGLV